MGRKNIQCQPKTKQIRYFPISIFYSINVSLKIKIYSCHDILERGQTVRKLKSSSINFVLQYYFIFILMTPNFSLSFNILCQIYMVLLLYIVCDYKIYNMILERLVIDWKLASWCLLWKKTPTYALYCSWLK